MKNEENVKTCIVISLFSILREFINVVFQISRTAILLVMSTLWIFSLSPGGLTSFRTIFSYSDKIFWKICVIQFYFDNEICQSLKQSTSELPEVVNILYDILAFLRKVCLIIILLSKKRGTASPNVKIKCPNFQIQPV